MLRPAFQLIAFALAAAGVGTAQKVISAKAGLVYFVLGRVSATGSGRLGIGMVNRQLIQGETLFSEDGRAEVLLNPGTVLRIGDMTRIRMESVDLADTRVSMEAGSAVVTVNRAPKFVHVQMQIGGAAVVIEGPGVYRFDADSVDTVADRLRVFSGQAEVSRNDQKMVVRGGRAVRLQEDLRVGKFDPKDADALQRWAELRGTPLPWSPLPTMACYSEPTTVAEAKDYIRDCLHLPAPGK